MEPLVSSLASQVAPEMVARLARPFGSDPETVGKALKLLAGLAVARLAAGASSAEGAAAVLRSLPQQEEPGLLASLVGAFKGDIPSETPADRMQALFGGGVNSMLASLSRTLGFDLGPLAGMLTPLFGQQLAGIARRQELDAAGFAQLLQYANEEFLAAPENAAAAAVIRDTLALGERAEAILAGFSAEELERIHTAPMAAYAMIAKASLSGIRSTLAEIRAAHRVGLEQLKEVEPVSLLGAVFGAGLSSSEAAELKREIASGDSLLETIRAAAAVVKAKAPAEADAFRRLVLEVACQVAEAGKEGGFLGFGGTRVNERERDALAQIRAALD